MKQTYDEAIAQVFKDEGGYTNDAADSGGPTNYGITIHDAQMYWKSNATADDVRRMPKSVASDIYNKHYAQPIGYNSLPSGTDYAILDYAVNSGVGRALGVLKKVGSDIDAIYDERESFLKAIVKNRPSQSVFLNGWMSRTKRGRKLAHKLATEYPPSIITSQHSTAAGTVIAGGAAAVAFPHAAIYIIPLALVAAVGIYFLIKYLKGK